MDPLELMKLSAQRSRRGCKALHIRRGSKVSKAYKVYLALTLRGVRFSIEPC
jgi:hypothetical protein